MSKMSVQVTSHADEVLSAKKQKLLAALEAIGIKAQQNVADLAPVDTGRLQASISYMTDSSEECVYIGTNVEYAAYVEYGTSKMDAQPYLKPGIMNNLDEYKRIAETYLK